MSKVYEIINNRIIEKLEEALENGDKPIWKQKWIGGTVNYVTRHQYRGINALLLEPGEYITFKQIKKLQEKNQKIKLKKGSKSEIVVYWSWYKLKKDGEVVLDENGNEKTYAKPFYYRVFNIKDVEGLESKFSINEDKVGNDEIDSRINDYANKEGVVIEEVQGSNRAYYSPGEDKVVVPNKNQFESIDSFYMTLLHELVHSTGHSKRLNRFEPGTSFGDHSYSKEELVAEIGANLIAGKLGIDIDQNMDNSVAYIQGWLSVLKNDKNFITVAMQEAQKAADLILDEESYLKDVAI